jgi:hypothetical protein
MSAFTLSSSLITLSPEQKDRFVTSPGSLSLSDYTELVTSVPSWVQYNNTELASTLSSDSCAWLAKMHNVSEDVASLYPLVRVPEMFYTDPNDLELLYGFASNDDVSVPDVIKDCWDASVRASSAFGGQLAALRAMPSSAPQPPRESKSQSDVEFPEITPFDFNAAIRSNEEVLKQLLEEDFDKFCYFLGTKYGIAAALKIVGSTFKLPDDEYNRMYGATTHITETAAKAFFRKNCSTAMSQLSEDAFSRCLREVILNWDGHLIETDVATYHLGNGAPYRVVKGGQDARQAIDRNVGEMGLNARIGDLTMDGVAQASMWAAIIIKATKLTTEKPYFMMTNYSLQKSESRPIALIDNEVRVAVSRVSAIPGAYERVSKPSQVAYLATVLGADKTCVPSFNVSGISHLPFSIYVGTCGVNESEGDYGVPLALTRARAFRKGTLFDDKVAAYKNGFFLMRLSKDSSNVIRYDPDLARCLHVLSDICRTVAKMGMKKATVMWWLSSTQSVGVIREMLLQTKTDCEFTHVFEFDGAEAPSCTAFWNTPSSTVVFSNVGAERFLLEAINGFLVRLVNPGQQNDYLNFSKQRNTVDATFSSQCLRMPREYQSIYYLVNSCVKTVVQCDKTTIEAVKGDFQLPYDTYFTTQGRKKAVAPPKQRGFVPIGHRPHSPLRIKKYAPGNDTVVICVDWASPASVAKSQLVESLVMSQNRYRVWSCYESPEIMELGLSIAKRVVNEKRSVPDIDC